MNQGFGLNYKPNFFMVRDSGHVPPGMDCLQLQLQPHQLRTQPFHYLINEQAKSLLALQELQNEVGALLEFRDLVMETFPNLRQKMSNSSSHNFANAANYCSNLPLPLSGSLNSRHWEPGIKVKRKIVNKSENESSFGRVRSNSHSSKMQSSQPKSSEAISGVQDSGFSTETNSSNKDQGSSTATSVPLPVQSDDPFLTRKESSSQKDSRRSEFDRSDEELSEDGLVLKVNEAEEELWNLLDVIHTKGTKLREEVETLQLRLVVEEIENHLREKELEIKKVGRKFSRRCRSLDSFRDGANSLNFNFLENEGFPVLFKAHDVSFEKDVFCRKRVRSIELEDVDQIREERNILLDRLAEMETENVANRIKTSELQNEISALISTKEELQEQLLQAVKQKNELNSRIHELHLKFVTGDRKGKCGGGKAEKGSFKDITDSESSQSEISSLLLRSKSSDDTRMIVQASKNPDKVNLVALDKNNKYNLVKSLGALDGIVSNPKRLKKYCKLSESSRRKLEAILKEKNYLELQRHLLVTVVENQALNQQLETSIRSQSDLSEQIDRYKKENDELLFQLEEKNIELEGTRAQVRVLEKLQQQSRPAFESRQGDLLQGENFTFLENDHLRSKGFSESEICRARQIFLESQNKKVDKLEMIKFLSRTRNSSPQRLNEVQNSFDLGKTSNVIPILALPLPAMSSHQSSETESTHALEISSELEADMARVDKNESLKDKSPYKRRPSKIPLNIQKNSKSLKSGMNVCSPSLKKSDSELSRAKDCSKKSLDNLQNSITSRSASQTPNSIKYNSVGRTGSQLSMASQKSHMSSKVDKKKSLTASREDNNSLTSGKNLNLKQTTNFSNSRQKDTLSRKNQNENPENPGKRTIRSSFRESFRSRISIDGNSMCSKKDISLSAGRKDSLQLRQNRSNSVQQKTASNKSNLATENDNTKCDEGSNLHAHTCRAPDAVNQDTLKEELHRVFLTSHLPSVKQESDIYVDSLNSSSKPTKPEKCSLFKEVRQNFQRRLAEKFSQTFSSRKISGPNICPAASSSDKNIWHCPKAEDDYVCDDVSQRTIREIQNGAASSEFKFFDSIDNSLDIDKDDSLLINSAYYCNKSIHNEAMADLDSLEVKLHQLD